jgi:arginine decarboxylase
MSTKVPHDTRIEDAGHNGSGSLLSTEEALVNSRDFVSQNGGRIVDDASNAVPLVAPDGWTIDDAIETYNIDRWGLGYFSINENGNVTVAPMREAGATIDIMQVIEESKEWDLRFPLVLRFQDLLRDRVMNLNKAFSDAILENKYRGEYRGVFPIKVNQLREVVEEIEDAGRPYNYGLEAGSKPELFAALATHMNPNALIICNGYKDTAFIRTALIGNRLGKKVVMIAEKVEEVRAILEVARELNVQPMIGVRVRLAAKSTGIWATSGGESAKFGLSTMDLMEASDYLRAEGARDIL